MKNTIAYLILQFACLTVFSQQKQVLHEAYPIEQQLELLQDNKAIDSGFSAVESIRKQLSKSDAATVSDDSKWTLIYFNTFGWREQIPTPRRDYNQIFKAVGDQKIYGIQEIKTKFQITDIDAVRTTSQPLTESLAAGRYYRTTLNNDTTYLIVATTHSYPHGNQTSWFDNDVYYFKKVE